MNRDQATKDLLKFAITAGDGPSEKSEPAPKRNEEEKKFLKSAIEAYVASHRSLTEELIELINILKQHLPGQVGAENHQVICDLLEAAGEKCENIDVACDLHKIGGFDDAIFKFLDFDESDEVRGWAANVIGSSAQNNPYVQEKLLESGIMSKLLEMTKSENTFVAVKSMYAVSCMIRQNETSIKKFLALNGFDFLSQCLTRPSKKLQMKSIFLMRSLCSEFKFCFPIISTDNTVVSLCDIITTPANDEDGDLIDCALSLLLALSTHDRGVVDIIMARQDFPKMLKTVETQFGEVWTDIAKNSQFILHLLQRKRQQL